MAVSTTDTYSGPYEANGVTVEFPFTFKAVSRDDVGVFIRDAAGNDTVVSDSDYSVTLIAEGGTVTMLSPPSTGSIFVFSEPSFLQPVNFASGQPFLPSVVNDVNDRDVVRALYLKREIDRAPKVPIGGGAEGKFPVVRPDGSWGFGSGTGNDPALRTDLAQPGGSGYVNFRHAGAGAQARPSEEKLRDTVDAKDFGALGDSANDDYPAIMAALAAHGRVHLSHSATNHYMVSQPIHLTDGQVLTSDLGVTIFGTGVNGALLLTGGQICVDVGQVVAPAAQYCVRYYDLVWSVVRIRRAGLCSKAVFFMDGDAQTANAGVNEWHIGDIQAGSCEYGVWLKNSPTKTYEGDVWRIRCILSATVCMLKIGETPAAHTLRWNEFHLAVDAQGITPLLIDFNQDQNHVILYNWAGIVGPPVAHVTFNALVGGNRLDSFPGIQDPLIVRDFGFNTWEAQGQAGNKSVGAVTTFGYISGTGLEIVNVENKSKANVATKYVGFGFFGRDTADSGKNVAVVRAVPLDGDWVNSLLELHFRRNDALTRAAAFGDKTVLFDRLQSLNYASDAAASAGGVPIGGLYHNAGAVRIRLA